MSELLELAKDAGPYGACFAMYLFYLYKTRGQKMGSSGTRTKVDNTTNHIEKIGRDLLDYSQIKSDVRLLTNNHEHEVKMSEDNKKEFKESIDVVHKRIDALEDMFKKHLEESTEARIVRERKEDITQNLLKQILDKK